MSNPISHIHKAFESRIRLGIMSVLMTSDWVDFITLKELLEVTDGNLASHLKSLEELDMMTVRKQFVGRKPKTSYQATPKGKELFQEHLSALEKLIRKS